MPEKSVTLEGVNHLTHSALKSTNIEIFVEGFIEGGDYLYRDSVKFANHKSKGNDR